TNVQAALTDGERELIVVHDDVEVRPVRLLIAGHRDAGDLRGSEGVLGVDDDVVIPGDDVDLLAAQLPDDRLHARALHADAGADGVDVTFAGHHGDLRAVARLADCT